MIDDLVRLCFQRRGIVLLIFVLMALYGIYCWQQLPVEAYPDIAPVTSQVITQVNGLAAEEIEQQITIPLEREFITTPGLSIMRSRSTFGLSLITLVFDDNIEDYWSRERIHDTIDNITLPYNAVPWMDALVSPVGEIYRYTLNSDTYSLRELSELQFWMVIPRLKKVKNVIEVINFGGLTTQFMVELDPLKLAKYGLTYTQVTQAIQDNNANAGGGILHHGAQGMVIRGIGLIRSLQDLGAVVLRQNHGTAIRIRDVGNVILGNKQRHGMVGEDHESDKVEGIVELLRGKNPSLVIDGLHAAVKDLNDNLLPAGVKIVPYLDRSVLVQATVHTVSDTLAYGMTLVALVLLFFLGNVWAAVIVALTIPFALLFAFICMDRFHIPANLLSLGAIDFGILVDGSIVVMENILRRRERNETQILTPDALLVSVLQVSKPIFFGILVIITAYSVLFAFQQIEYKLFSPMAFAVGFSLIGALLVALTLIPGLAYSAYRKPLHVYQNVVLNRLIPVYQNLLKRILGKTKLIIGSYIGLLGIVVVLFMCIGRDFLPYLDEGSIWLQVILPPGISLKSAGNMAQELRNAALEFPQVDHIVTQLGRNDDGTDPFTPSHIEAAVTLTPYKTWPLFFNKQMLIQKMAARYAQIPGMHISFTQPMIDGVLDKVAGAHSDLVVKVNGHNLQEMRTLAQSILHVLQPIPGAQDLIIDQEPPMTELRIKVNREALGRFGVKIADVMDLIQMGMGGFPVSGVYVDERRYEVSVRLKPTARGNIDKIGELLLSTSSGAHIALAQIAQVRFALGETTITHEMLERQILVRLNLRGRDLVSFVKQAQSAIERQIHYDHKVFQVSWGGQLENQARAQSRFLLIMPMLFGLMFILLFYQFGNLRHPVLILLAMPLALLGGLAALLLRGMTLNVSSAVGFIAVFGVVVLNAIIMISNLNRWRLEHHTSLKKDIINGATERLRPVLMTASVAAIGMLPAAMNHGLGSDVQRPLATVIIGGLISATVLTLLILPGLYEVIERQLAQRQARKGSVL